jgi:hypothetical protein
MNTDLLIANIARQPFVVMVVASNADTTVSDRTTITINQPPSGGSFSIEPLQGWALSTNFTATISGWTDDATGTSSSSALTYSIAYKSPSGNETVLLQDITSFSTAQFTIPNIMFPQIQMSGDAAIDVILIVTDALNATQRVSQTITLLNNVTLFGGKSSSTYANMLKITPTTFNSINDVLLYSLTVASITQQFVSQPDPYQVCANDVGCYGHGRCLLDSFVSRCECELGFVGLNCQWTEEAISLAKPRTESALKWAYTTYSSREPVPSYATVKTLSGVVKKLLSNADLVSPTALGHATSIMTYVTPG